VAALARSALGPFQEAIRGSLSLSDNDMAVLQGPALALPLLILAVPFGMLVDRLPRVRILLCALAAAAVGALFTAGAGGFKSLFLARSLVGLAAPASSVIAASLISDLVAPDRRGRANMVVAIGQVIGMAAAFATSGLGFDTSKYPDAWRRAMWYVAMALILVLAITAFMREPPRRELDSQTTERAGRWLELLRARARVVPLLGGAGLVAIADGAALIWLAPLLIRQYGVSPADAGPLVAIVLLGGGLLGPVAGGLIADRCQRVGGPRRTLAGLTLLALLSAAAGLFPTIPTTLYAVIVMLLFMTLGVAMNVIVTALLTIVVPNELRGLCMAVLWAIAAFLGLGLAPLTVSLLSTFIGGTTALGRALSVVCVTTGLFGAASFYWGSCALRRAAT
jgi:MFS family permease